MSWKPTKRSLHVGPKIKLSNRQPLPDSANGMAVKVAEHISDERDEVSRSSRDPFAMPEFVASLPEDCEDVVPCLDKFDDFSDFDHGDDFYSEKLWYPGLCDSESSSWGQSVASFMSWSDEIEVETTEKVQEMLDEIEHTLYGEGPSLITNKELLAECHLWRSKFPHLRVIGVAPENLKELPSNFEVLAEDEEVETTDIVFKQETEDNSEVLASHGFCEDLQAEVFHEEQFVCDPAEDSDDYRGSSAGASLREKVKHAAMDQLIAYVWGEAIKSFEPVSRLYEDQTPQIVPLSSRRPNTRESAFCQGIDRKLQTPRGYTPVPSTTQDDLDSILQVSPVSLHRSPRKSGVRRSRPFHNDDTIESVRFSPNINSYNPDYKAYFQQQPPFTVLKLPTPVAYHSLGEVARAPAELRGYHSAADRKKSGLWDRRFSCVSTTGHDRLTPLEERQATLTARSTEVKQVSAPNSPAKWMRHITLPPIECLDPFSKHPRSSQSSSSSTCKNESNSRSSTASSRKKVSLSPLNIASTFSVEGEGLSRLEIAKQLLERAPDRGLWSNNGHVGATSVRELKETKGQRKSKPSTQK